MKTKQLLLALILLASTSNLWAAYPTILGDGTSTNPYKITTATELLQVRDSVNTFASPASNLAYYELSNDIDISGADWIVPIGVTGRFFKGTFNGNGYKITGITLGSSTAPHQNQALFGIVGPATIKNLEIGVNFNVVRTSATGNNYIGGLVNTISAGITTIDNCRVSGSISQTNSAPTSSPTNLKVGGIVAQIGGETYITNCSADLNITNTIGSGTTTQCLNSVGGIVADANTAMVSGIVNCYSTGTITAANGAGSISVGGIVGVRNGNTSNLCEVLNCYSAMTIDAAQSFNNNAGVGGIFGSQNNATTNNVKNCIALNPSITFKSTPTTAVKLFRVGIKNTYAGNFANNFALSTMSTTAYTAWSFTTLTGTAVTINPTYAAGNADGDAALTGADVTEQIADGLSKLNAYVTSNTTYKSTTLNSWIAGTTYPKFLKATNPSALEKIDGIKIKVGAVNGSIIVLGAEGKAIEIYNITGRKISTRFATENRTSISVNGTGVFLVKVDNKISKIIL